MQTKSRILPLDGLRAIAVFGVVWIYIWTSYQNQSFMIGNFDFYKSIAILGNGVDFFFVISGFCMYLVVSKIEFSFKAYFVFLKKRFIRIAPAYYFSLIVYALIKFNDPGFHFFKSIFAHFLFLSTVINTDTISGPFWSIATEWHFYMLLPLLLTLASRFRLIPVVISLSALSILFFMLVNLGYFSYDFWQPQILIRFPEFGVGIIISYLYINDYSMHKWLKNGKGLLVALLIMFMGRSMRFTPLLHFCQNYSFLIRSFSDTIMTTGFGILLLHVITEKTAVSTFLSNRFFSYLGKISFSIYLWHSLSIIILYRLLINFHFGKFNSLVAFVFVSMLTILIAHVSYFIFESFYFKKSRQS